MEVNTHDSTTITNCSYDFTSCVSTYTSDIVIREEKCDVMLPWQHYFWMTTKPTTKATARRSAKNDMFILTNNN